MPMRILCSLILILSIACYQNDSRPPNHPDASNGLQQDRPQSQTKADQQTTLLAHVTRGRIKRISLHYEEETITLEQVPGGWILPEWGNYPADAIYAKFLIDTLFRAPSGEVIASGPAALAEYELDQPFVRIHLQDETKNVLEEVVLGKTADNYRSIYVRLGQDEQVRFVNADLFPATSRIGWLNREVWRFPENLVQAIEWKNGDRSWRMVLEDRQWRVISPQGMEPSAAFQQTTLSKLIHLNAGYARYKPIPESQPQMNLQLTIAGFDYAIALTPFEDHSVALRREDMAITWYLSKEFIKLLNSAVIPAT